MDNEFKPYKHDDLMGDYYEHPTFGVLHIGRGQGGGRPLFGSSILHNTRISLTISHAELNRNLNKDSIFEKGLIVECEMSPTQFADAITSLNVGSGTPVTIRMITHQEGENLHRVDPPFQNKVAQFNEEFDQSVKGLGKHFDSVIQLAKDTKAQKRLISEIELLKGFFENNIPFVNEQFSEQMETTVKEAKGEVEAFVNQMVQNYGIEAIRQQAPQLTEEGDDKPKLLKP